MATDRWDRDHRHRGLSAVLFLVMLVACSDGNITASNGDVASPDASRRGVNDPSSTTVESLPRLLAEVDGAAGRESRRSSTKSAIAQKGPPPIDFPYKNELTIQSSVSPVCVLPGESIDISIKGPPESGVAYQAVYSDGWSGSAPPFGAGYGGNEGGYADSDGEFAGSWTVSPSAPPGRARVDVFVGAQGKWGYAESRFAVADSDGDCPEKWLRGP